MATTHCFSYFSRLFRCNWSHSWQTVSISSDLSKSLNKSMKQYLIFRLLYLILFHVYPCVYMCVWYVVRGVFVFAFIMVCNLWMFVHFSECGIDVCVCKCVWCRYMHVLCMCACIMCAPESLLSMPLLVLSHEWLYLTVDTPKGFPYRKLS